MVVCFQLTLPTCSWLLPHGPHTPPSRWRRQWSVEGAHRIVALHTWVLNPGFNFDNYPLALGYDFAIFKYNCEAVSFIA